MWLIVNKGIGLHGLGSSLWNLIRAKLSLGYYKKRNKEDLASAMEPHTFLDWAINTSAFT
jgi:hypothetical protein